MTFSYASALTSDIVVKKECERPIWQGTLDMVMTAVQENDFYSPLKVRKLSGGKYELEADEVIVFVAAQQLGIKSIPVVIVKD